MIRASLPNKNRQEGIALLTAVLIVALVTLLVTQLVSRQGLDIRRTENMIFGDRAYLLSLGAEAWAAQILAHDRRENEIDHLHEDWATVIPPIAVEGGEISGQIADLDGRFNINGLVKEGVASEKDVERFRRLLEKLDLDADLVYPLVDWLDKDSDPSLPNGAEDDAYTSLEPPYRAANGLMVSPSELRLVSGYTREVYEVLEPFIATLPVRTTVNVNTAPAEVLATIMEDMTLGDGESLVEERGEKGFESLDDFFDQGVFTEREEDYERTAYAVASRYFLISGRAEYGRGQVSLYSILYRNDEGKTEHLLRSLGNY